MAQTKDFLTVGELYAALEARMPRSLSCDWDRDGLSFCPDTEARVTGVIIALDPTEDAISLARETGCNVLLTHHPLIFHGLTAINGGDVVSRRVLSLAAAGISAMSFHTRLDAVAGGVNDVLAGLLGLEEVVPFGEAPSAGMPIGRIGLLPEVTDMEAFTDRLSAILSVPPAWEDGEITAHLTSARPPIQYAACDRAVHRVAVLGGGGDDEVEAARAAGADTYVTGELKYHQLCDAPFGDMNLISAGHYFTEFPVCRQLGRWVSEIASAAGTSVPLHVLGGVRTRTK